MSKRSMIVHRKEADGWIGLYEVSEDGSERSLGKVRLPEGGATVAEMVEFGNHLIKMVRERQHGAN